MKNCIADIEAVEFALNNIKKITDVVGKINLVFPPYKAAKKYWKKIIRFLPRR